MHRSLVLILFVISKNCGLKETAILKIPPRCLLFKNITMYLGFYFWYKIFLDLVICNLIEQAI